MAENHHRDWKPSGFELHTRERVAYWDSDARSASRYDWARAYYRRRLQHLYRFNVPEGMRVLEVGCGAGDLLAAVRPRYGVGIDFSGAAIEEARRRHPHLTFFEADAHCFETEEPFDFILCSDLVNDLWDVQRVFERLHSLSRPGTRILLNAHSRLWQGPRAVAEWLAIAKPMLDQNWLTAEDIGNLLYLSGFEVIRRSQEIMCPVRAPLLDELCNRYLVKLWPFRHLGITNLIVARPQARPRAAADPVVSVVVPARNEAGNIGAIFDRVPDMGAGTELIFVEGNSGDGTWEVIEQEAARRKRPRTAILRQPGTGKGDAVRHGFAHATGDLLMILDADLTVPPEDLPRFYEAWRSCRGEFINGVRLVYPMEQYAMGFFNLIANRFFSLAFSWLLGQSIKDTLCGTKALSRDHYLTIAANRSYFGDFDPFGDFDLIFGAAKHNLKFVDLPVRYRERTYGETNIRRWRDGFVLLRMVLYASRRIKFV